MPNYGFKPDEIAPEDYILGGITSVPKEVLQKDKDWTPYLPVKEYQNLNNIEPYACVSFTVLNCIEALIMRKYGIEKNYSDRFLASVSGTKEGGNSPKVVCEFLRKIGVVPQDIWPFDEKIYTFEKFYEKIPPKLYQIAREFLDEFEFKYEQVPPNKLEEAIMYSPLLISVYAWIQELDLYVKPNGAIDNHATTYVQWGEDHRLVFDSYDSAYKKVDVKALPMQAVRFYIKKKEKKGFWQKVREYFDEILK